jgi:hypothetical protein
MYSIKLQLIAFQREFCFKFKPTEKKVRRADHEEINIAEYSDNARSLVDNPSVTNLF